MMNSTNMRSNLFRLSAVALFIHACGSYESYSTENDDPRVGEHGLVRFAGDGCSSSTTLAVGSTVEMVAEPVDEDSDLPSGLEFRSSHRDVIDASNGAEYGELILTANGVGEAEVELVEAGDVYDYLVFSAELARQVLFSAEDAVFAGGTYQLKIDEVYGTCGGEECPLIGGGFLEWSSDPADALVVQEDGPDRWAHFSTLEAGEVRLSGREPTTGDVLVVHYLTAVSPETAGELEATFMVQLPDETVLEDQTAPLEVPFGSLILPQVRADAEGQDRVLLAGADVAWTVSGSGDVVELWSEVDEDPPEGPIFLALKTGTVTLSADVELLDRSGAFEVNVFDPDAFD